MSGIRGLLYLHRFGNIAGALPDFVYISIRIAIGQGHSHAPVRPSAGFAKNVNTGIGNVLHVLQPAVFRSSAGSLGEYHCTGTGLFQADLFNGLAKNSTGMQLKLIVVLGARQGHEAGGSLH